MPQFIHLTWRNISNIIGLMLVLARVRQVPPVQKRPIAAVQERRNRLMNDQKANASAGSFLPSAATLLFGEGFARARNDAVHVDLG